MGWKDLADGWAVRDDQGLNVKTVAETRRAAIVNWLVVEAERLVLRNTTDEQIEAMWEANCGDAVAIRVQIHAR